MLVQLIFDFEATDDVVLNANYFTKSYGRLRGTSSRGGRVFLFHDPCFVAIQLFVDHEIPLCLLQSVAFGDVKVLIVDPIDVVHGSCLLCHVFKKGFVA